MKYEEIIRWRQDVFDATLSAHLVSSKSYISAAAESASSDTTPTKTPNQREITAQPELAGAIRDPHPKLQDWTAVPLQKPFEGQHQQLQRAFPFRMDNEDLLKCRSLPLPGQRTRSFTTTNADQDKKHRPVSGDIPVPPPADLLTGEAGIETTDLDKLRSALLIDNTAPTPTPAVAPAPVPASLAPAQGHFTPKIMKRPVSASFSSIRSDSPARTSPADARSRSTTQTSMITEEPVHYALGLNDKSTSEHPNITEHMSEVPLNVDAEPAATPRMLKDTALPDFDYEFPPLPRSAKVINRM